MATHDPSEALDLLARPMIYVAAYYTADPIGGAREAMEAFDALLAAGWLPVVPHVNMLLDLHTRRPPAFWYAYDLALLARCDALYVCQSLETLESPGVKEEIAFAIRRSMPVFFEPLSPPLHLLERDGD